MQKITVISTYLGSEKEGGGAKRTLGMTKALAGRFDVTRLNFSEADRKDKGHAQTGTSYAGTDFHKPTFARKAFSLFNVPCPLRQYYSSKLWDFPKNAQDASAESRIIQVEQPYIFGFAKRHLAGGKIVLSAHNFEAEHVRDALEKNPISALACKKIESIEKTAVRDADMIITVTEDDRDSICRNYGEQKSKAVVCANGADTNALKPVGRDEKKRLKKRMGLNPEKKLAIFCGSNYSLNNKATEFIFSKLVDCAPENLEFMVLGETWAAKPPKNVFLTGYVEDIAPYFQAADIALNPTTNGGGSSIKMVEYLAAGLPIVSTEIGARGINAKNGKDIIISSLDEFSGNISLLAGDENLRAKMSENARKLAERRYDWKKTTGLLVKKYAEMLRK